MTERLADKIAVVTGGGAGIGEATCLRFAEERAHVVVVDRYESDAVETVKSIEEDGGPEALAVEADVSDELAVEAMAQQVADRFGSVDVLVNNAGIRVDPKPVTKADEESWDRIFNVNLKGTAFCSKHVIPLMEEGGAVVNVASVGAGTGRAGWAQYDSTKGGIISMTHDMACDHASDGVRVNAVSPGWVITDYHIGDRTGEEATDFVEEKTTWGGNESGILKRAAKPRELADAILFLASEESSFITGSNIPVDGGTSVI